MPIIDRRFILTNGPPWGFRIYLDNTDAVTISMIRRHSPAEDAKLKSGDQIISVNGKSIAGLRHSEVVMLIDTAFGTMDIHVSRFESVSSQLLTFDKMNFIISQGVKGRNNLIRCERTPEETKVPACTPELEECSINVVKEITSTLRKIRSPSPEIKAIPVKRLMQEFIVHEKPHIHVPKKKEFAESSFDKDLTTDEKMGMSRRIAASLYDPCNRGSKGASIFENQRKRIEKYTLQNEEVKINGLETSQSKYDYPKWSEIIEENRRSNSPITKLECFSRQTIPPPPPPQIPRLDESYSKSKKSPISKDISFDIASALHNSDSRGAQIFAMQKQRSQKWTITTPDTLLPEALPAAPLGHYNICKKRIASNEEPKSRIVSISRSQVHAFNEDNKNLHEMSVERRRPTHVIHRNSSQGPVEQIKVENKLTLSMASNVTTLPPTATFQTVASTKWKPVKFNIPQKAS